MEMKAGGKVLWKSPCRRWCAVALACVMILTMAAPLPVLAYSAETEPNGSAEESGPAGDLDDPVGSETPGDSQSPEDSEPGEDSEPPEDSEPGEDNEPPLDNEPGDGTSQPEDPQPPEEETTPPEGTVPPAEETTPPADAETDPAAPPAQQPGASLACPHGDPENCGLCVTAWTWQEDANLAGAMRWIEDAVPEEGETSDQAPAKGGKWVLGLPGLGE